jgi:soluble lytic murein transglycosylase-like protein
LNPKINLTYAVPYLANAYRLADGDEDRAVTLFSSGYYYTAHQKKMLATLRTASSPPVAAELLPPPEPVAQLCCMDARE